MEYGVRLILLSVGCRFTNVKAVHVNLGMQL